MVTPCEEEQFMQTDELFSSHESDSSVPAPTSDADSTEAADTILHAFDREFRGLILAESESGDGDGTAQVVDGTRLSRADEEGQGIAGKPIQGSELKDYEEGGWKNGEEGASPEVVEADDKPKLECLEGGATEGSLREGLETAAYLEEVKDKAANDVEDATTQHAGEKLKKEQNELITVVEETGNEVRPVENGDEWMDDEQAGQENGNRTGVNSKLEKIQNRDMEESQKEGNVVKGDAKNEGHIEEEVPCNEKEGTVEERNKIQYCYFPQRPNAPDCAYYLKTGKCAYGLNCRFNHPLKGVQNGEKECPSYMHNGLYKFSINCRSHHPDATTAIGNNFLSAYNGAHTKKFPGALQLKLGPSFASSRQPSPVSDSSHRPNSYNYQQPMPDFPQRYGQPDCPYYMKTGDCKYRSVCKFNHPKNYLQGPPKSPSLYHLKGRSQHPAASRPLLNPRGLPLRPGQDVCIYYKNQEICKFGPSCKYDHPMKIPAQREFKPRG